MSNFRKLYFEEKVWLYKIGSGGIKIKSPNNKTAYVSFGDLTGLSVGEIEKGQWKRWFHVTPKQIKKYIIEHFLGRL